MIDQVFILPPLPGVAENLETVKWYLDKGKRFACDVECRLCDVHATARVMPRGEMHDLDRRFWLHHFQTCHAEKLPGIDARIEAAQ